MDKDPEVEIRLLELEDLAAVYDLGERLYTAKKWTNLYRFWDEYEVVELFHSDGDTCLVAELDGRIIGFALGMVIEKRKSSWIYGYLVWLGVDQTVGRRGVGQRLLHRLTEIFIEQGARMMFVDTAGDNHEAIAFFEKNGFGGREGHVFFSRNLTRHPAYARKRRKLGRRRAPTARPAPPTPDEPPVDERSVDEPSTTEPGGIDGPPPDGE